MKELRWLELFECERKDTSCWTRVKKLVQFLKVR